MNKKLLLQLGAVALFASLFSSCIKEPPPCTCTDNPKPTVTIFGTGFNNPRGLKFGPDGYLYVAEGGTGGTNSSVGQCTQVPFPVGPYKGSTTGGRISRLSTAGVRTTVTNQLPSSQANEIVGGDVEGVADVAFMDNTLYAVLAGAGCSHGVPSVPNGVVRINNGGSWTMIANLSTYFMSHPVQNPEPDDFEPDGTPYSMITVDHNFYALEPNHGELVKITPGGTVSRVADISASQGHIVPTALTFHDNSFFAGNLHTFPIVEGSSKIYKISMDGQVKVWATGFTTVLGIVFDKKGRLYVLENTTGSRSLTPGTGKIIRVDKSGGRETIVSGLSLPTGMTFGPDGKLYVSNIGLGPLSRGGGQILQIDLHTCECEVEIPAVSNK